MIKTGVQIKWFSKLVTSYQMIPLMDDKISQIIPLRDQFPAPKYIFKAINTLNAAATLFD